MTMELESPFVMWAPPLASTMPASYGWCDAAARSVEMACSSWDGSDLGGSFVSG